MPREAAIDYDTERAHADEDRDGFWAAKAEAIEWQQRWHTVREFEPPDHRWFLCGTLNATVSCIDRHVHSDRRNKAALIWIGEEGEERTYTYRRGKAVHLKPAVDEAVRDLYAVEHVIVHRRGSRPGDAAVEFESEREHDFYDIQEPRAVHCEPVAVAAEHPLFILYTSGTTGRPKGVVHATGGYMVGVTYLSRAFYQIQERDIYWSTSDIGWVVDNWWQTEIAGPVLGTPPSFEARPGKVGKPLPGVEVAVVDPAGKPVEPGQGGLLVLKGERIKAFVVVKPGVETGPGLIGSLRDHVCEDLGPIAQPSEIELKPSLPKTRSGKIMRRLLKTESLGEDPGDTSTLAD